jgi:hypothetical protein
MNQTNNRIREEWKEWAFTHKQHLGRMCDRKEIEDYWISKIDELLKSQRDEERLRSAKIVEELMEDSEHWQPIASRIMDRVIIGKEDLSLIKNN